MTEFHWLRPWWLWALVSLVFVVLLFRRQKTSDTHWQQVCDPHLLPHLLQRSSPKKQLISLVAIALAISIAVIALAGPTWSRSPQTLYHSQTPWVLVLDLSDAMLKDDIKPTRLERSKFKLQDLLKQLTHDDVGLVVFTAQPFVVSPLTEDATTINALVPELSTGIMPVNGSNIAAALQQAGQLITQTGATQGNIILLTASNADDRALTQAAALAAQSIHTSVLKIATHATGLAELATKGNGNLVNFTEDNQDIAKLIDMKSQLYNNTLKKTHLTAAQWQDEGRYLVLCLLPLALCAFRRGWLENIYQ